MPGINIGDGACPRVPGAVRTREWTFVVTVDLDADTVPERMHAPIREALARWGRARVVSCEVLGPWEALRRWAREHLW